MLNKEEIVGLYALSGRVETLAKNIIKRSDAETPDLTQDIYVELLQKPEALIEELWNKGELDYFIVRMLLNNIYSKNSPYYYKYQRYNKNKDTLNDEC